jgi:uncharacterized membrane protein YhaH (DUF805 family)
MEAIIAALLSGFFSLAAIWYQNYLQKKSNVNNDEIKRSGSVKNELPGKSTSPALRIVFTLVIVACPLLLLLLIGKERLSDGDKYLMEYYLIWSIITLIAVIIGWARKTSFEKIILIVSLIFLIYMTFEVNYENNRNKRLEQMYRH